MSKDILPPEERVVIISKRYSNLLLRRGTRGAINACKDALFFAFYDLLEDIRAERSVEAVDAW